MCLGIVGQIVALPEEHGDLAIVDVAGLNRPINVAILEGEQLAAPLAEMVPGKVLPPK